MIKDPEQSISIFSNFLYDSILYLNFMKITEFVLMLNILNESSKVKKKTSAMNSTVTAKIMW